MRMLIAAALALVPVAVSAQEAPQDVALTSEVLAERTETGADGTPVIRLEAPRIVTPGDPLLFKLKYRNTTDKPVENFRITNPIPDAVSFVETSSPDVSYSLDGATWGPLAALKVRNADGSERAATPADVRSLQFVLTQPIPAGGSGEVSFRGVVK